MDAGHTMNSVAGKTAMAGKSAMEGSAKASKISINGTDYQNDPGHQTQVNDAINAAVKTGSINGKPLDTAAGKHELSYMRHIANGKTPEEAKTLSDARPFKDGPLKTNNFRNYATAQA